MTEDDTTDDSIEDTTDGGIDEPSASDTSDDTDGDGTGSEPVAHPDGGASTAAGARDQYIPAAEIPDSRPARDRDWAAWLRDHAPSLRRTLTYVVAIGVAILWIVPFIGLFMASLRPLSEIIGGWWQLEGMTLTLENYQRAWEYQTAPLGRALINTMIVTVPAVLVVMLLGAMAAYPFARFEFPLKTVIFFAILLVMAAPPELVAMGNYNTLRNTGMFDTYMGLILVHIGWGLGWVVLFLRNYLLGIPEELEEAARIDGASRFQIFRTIILPLSVPALVSVAVIQFTWVWNAFFFPLVFMRSPDLYLAPQVLPLMRGRLQVDWGLVAAGSIMTMVVPIVLFLLLERYYTRGMVAAVVD
ncbi:binding-protein-dependent transport system inner membrane protein [Halovivax asiaticus JCM 14624]|uniref:Binding-protein-dependent transport system inner membrane protein n=1 Tax=Halovivax asiaticus JCM 14624 TaxID=1227490 RepID=M0BBZ1_9EURY|nr:carbohydrate ABC transporter permease [Halovivax asiaticus]ELZ07169.1 binding-protein-dependent transport system inner membrane protein [Halovivax asiaticus JCM 14624]